MKNNLAEYTHEIIVADMGGYPQVFVSDRRTGAPVFSSSYKTPWDPVEGFICAGVDLAHMTRDETWFLSRDCDPELDPELFWDAHQNSPFLGQISDGRACVMTPSDLIDYCGDYNYYCFVMAYHMELYRDTRDWGDETEMRDFCLDFLANPSGYSYDVRA